MTSTAPREIYDSTARPAPFKDELLSLLRYRDLITQLISRSLKTRYKRSILGVAWTMLNPLLTMLVLTLVFSNLFQSSTGNYALYVLSGLLAWNFFAQTTTAAVGDLIWSGGLIGRIFVPKTVFAVAAIGTGLVNLALALIPYALIAIVLGEPPRAAIMLLPLPALALSAFSLGVGLAISSMAVYFPDVMPMYEVLLTAWLYLTPVIYPLEILPENAQGLLRLNPMLYTVRAFRAVLLEGVAPQPSDLALSAASGVLVLLVGWWMFTRKARDYAIHV